MPKYILKRVLQSILILLLVGLIIYGLLRCLPTSYIENMARQLSTQPGSKSFEEWMTQLESSYGLDKGIVAGYLSWLKNAIRFDFGDSWVWTMPVLEKFEKTEFAPRLKAAGVITSYICPLMYMNNPLCKKMPVITSSNKLRTYTSARYYTDAEILTAITGGNK